MHRIAAMRCRCKRKYRQTWLRVVGLLFRDDVEGYGIRCSSKCICNLHSPVLKTGLPNRIIVKDKAAYNSRAGDMVVLEPLILLLAQAFWSIGSTFFGNLGMLVLE
jgi:hypothetical protein